jgi:hypothetical protein
MKLAMYKGPPDDFWHKVGHTATRVWTRSRYSHCELVFSEPGADGLSLCASSSARDGGVRFKRIDLSSGRWDVYGLPDHDAFDAAYARQWFDDHAGLPYDHLGLVWFVLPIGAFDRSKRWFCSEAIAAALRMRRPHKFHPQRVLDAVVTTGGPP